MNRLTVVALGALLGATPASAQTEAALQQYFGGKTVVVRLDMPATSDGVDIYPGTPQPLDFTRYAARLKATGTALRTGEPIIVTRVRVKDKLIEFHLGGGGFGTLGDDTSTSVYVPSASKTTRERNLERDVKRETDAAKKRAMQEELDDLKKEREREDRRNQAAAAEAEEAKKQRIAVQRLGGGSRFNVRFRLGVPAGMTPDALMLALNEYVGFPWMSDGPVAGSASSSAPVNGGVSASAPAVPYKGMSFLEAQRALGRPEETTERMEGTLKVTSATFSRQDQVIQAEFVEGVLVRYSIASR